MIFKRQQEKAYVTEHRTVKNRCFFGCEYRMCTE